MFLEKKQEKQLQQKNKNKKKAQKSFQIRSYPWSVFSSIRCEHGNLRSKSANSVRMQENMDQNNSVFGHFSRSVR